MINVKWFHCSELRRGVLTVSVRIKLLRVKPGVLNETKSNFRADIIGVTPIDTDDSRKPAIAAKEPPRKRTGRAAAGKSVIIRKFSTELKNPRASAKSVPSAFPPQPRT
jgi:hypothetical protein